MRLHKVTRYLYHNRLAVRGLVEEGENLTKVRACVPCDLTSFLKTRRNVEGIPYEAIG